MRKAKIAQRFDELIAHEKSMAVWHEKKAARHREQLEQYYALRGVFD